MASPESTAAQESQTPSVGVAYMKADGTIVLQLRAQGSGGTVGDSQIEYPPDHPDYAAILAHIGPVAPGEQVLVRPFPESW